MSAEFGELTWGMPVVLYLFLAGMGAGAAVTSASILLRGPSGLIGKNYPLVARYGAFLAPLPVMIGCGLLIFELGSFQAGNWFRFINLYKVMNLSPMSVGTWLLTVFIPLSLVYAATFLPWLPQYESMRDRVQRGCAWIVVPMGLGVAVYTGVLLGAMPSRPFWNTPMLAMLFMISSLSTGVAATQWVRVIHEMVITDPEKLGRMRQNDYILTTTDVMLISFELLMVFLFLMYAHLTVGGVKTAISVVLPGGELATMFWTGFVLIGLLLPGLAELFMVLPRLLHGKRFHSSHATDLLVTSAVIFGGFMLRYVVLIAGQITGPTGI